MAHCGSECHSVVRHLQNPAAPGNGPDGPSGNGCQRNLSDLPPAELPDLVLHLQQWTAQHGQLSIRVPGMDCVQGGGLCGAASVRLPDLRRQTGAVRYPVAKYGYPVGDYGEADCRPDKRVLLPEPDIQLHSCGPVQVGLIRDKPRANQ